METELGLKHCKLIKYKTRCFKLDRSRRREKGHSDISFVIGTK